jgi:hypothetical protein
MDDRLADRKIVDSKCRCTMKHCADRSIDKFKVGLLETGYSQILGQNYDTRFAIIVYFKSLLLPFSMIAENGFTHQEHYIKPGYPELRT